MVESRSRSISRIGCGAGKSKHIRIALPDWQVSAHAFSQVCNNTGQMQGPRSSIRGMLDRARQKTHWVRRLAVFRHPSKDRRGGQWIRQIRRRRQVLHNRGHFTVGTDAFNQRIGA